MDSKEVCELTGIEPENLHGRMATSIRNGWLQRTNPGVGRGIRSVYSEGPKLRKVLGRE